MDDDEKSTKSSSSKKSKAATTGKTYEERVKNVNVISKPLASKKSTKKLHKLVKKASGVKYIRRGVKEVVKGVRKGEKGLAILAGDIYPLDVVSHLPVLLEENNIPYIFVPSKQDLGAAASTKRPTSCVLVRTPKKEFEGQDIYDTMMKEANEYDPLS
uniref:H/ACA ribonucleoprotein complex subunit 2 n=1 Tax=Grammatophora oceanica TaxID=210454 RepID=A0A7S1YDK8_9STRA|mmetsp:Transcript_40622/g.60244  ORF Transcript_40622/g.60244 Transcript_40622/m.60244 type:complete len:158 (+) Transcript_40622:140-613(+)|eukprot:CAMPEP_0194036922 /NCGR_PEP_ID=MMETSP0009_2-20130614/9297_1 /TAXON_ID=210454 /ORGANISM="Grammatophora oceanica, Strain CCMP 410" /LENGTH=157 /DNA_ID=CAMNT_0038678877 /DNA_START=57 /DNA_END=530 /DNA_ORIENTATION=-